MSFEGTERPRGVAFWLVVSVLASTTLLAILMSFGIALQIMMLADEIHAPSPTDAQPGAYVLGILISIALSAFFVMLSKRLYRTLRGDEPQHLVPAWLAVPLSGALGAGGIVAGLTSSGPFGGYAIGTGIGFVFYAGFLTYRGVRRL